MACEEHISSEEAEQEIINAANGLPMLKHDYDDCGRLHHSANDVETFIIPLGSQKTSELLKTMPKERYFDAFISLQANRPHGGAGNQSKEYLPFFKSIDEFLARRQIAFCKGETTFISGKPYAVLALTRNEQNKALLATVGTKNNALIGTIDSYVEGRHFRRTNNTTNPGFYAASAAISDIGANGGTPLELHLNLINASRKKRAEFIKGAEEAAKFNRIRRLQIDETRNPELGEFCAAFTIIGEVPEQKEMTLKGLEEGMRVYLAGRAGISKANDYFMIKEHLEYNLSPAFRQSVFDNISSKALCNDVSDGVDKSLRNLLRHSTGLDIIVDDCELMKTGYNPFRVYVTLDDIKYGGDDYCLIIATNSELERVPGVQEIGRVERGEGRVIYKD